MIGNMCFDAPRMCVAPLGQMPGVFKNILHLSSSALWVKAIMGKDLGQAGDEDIAPTGGVTAGDEGRRKRGSAPAGNADAIHGVPTGTL